jgi:flagellar biosynthesis GTPase FlhF
MALDSIPPWLQINPSYFTAALEAGARTGLAVADQNQRAQQMAEARAARIAEQQARAQQDAERQREFEQSHLLNVQKVAQDAAQLAQQQRHQNALELNQQAQESRLLDYDKGRIAVQGRQVALDEAQAKAPTVWVPPTGDAPGYLLDRRGTPHIPPGNEPMMPTPKPEDIGQGITAVRVSPQHYQVIDKPTRKLPVDVAQEVAWRNADIKAAQALKETLLKAGTRADAPDIVKLDQAIDEHKNAVRLLQKPAGGGAASTLPAMPAPRTKAERDALPTGTRYKGPDGRTYIKK